MSALPSKPLLLRRLALQPFALGLGRRLRLRRLRRGLLSSSRLLALHLLHDGGHCLVRRSRYGGRVGRRGVIRVCIGSRRRVRSGAALSAALAAAALAAVALAAAALAAVALAAALAAAFAAALAAFTLAAALATELAAAALPLSPCRSHPCRLHRC